MAMISLGGYLLYTAYHKSIFFQYKNLVFFIFCVVKMRYFLYSVNVDFLIWISIRVGFKLECIFLILLGS